MKKKYSAEFRLEVVRYRTTAHSNHETAKKFNIDPTTVERWYSFYQREGKESLRAVNKFAEFDADFKLKVVLSVLNEKLSLREAEKLYNLRSKTVITNWLRQYELEGINGLQPKKGKYRLLKPEKKIDPEQAKIDKNKTQDELLEEIAYLRAEVAVLKKRRALILQSEANAQQRLSKSSRN